MIDHAFLGSGLLLQFPGGMQGEMQQLPRLHHVPQWHNGTEVAFLRLCGSNWLRFKKGHQKMLEQPTRSTRVCEHVEQSKSILGDLQGRSVFRGEIAVQQNRYAYALNWNTFE